MARDRMLPAPAAENLRRMTDGKTAPASIEALSRMSSVHWLVIAAISTAQPISGSKHWIGARLFDRVELAGFQVLDPGSEAVAQQVAEAEHMVHCPCGIGIVFGDTQIGLMGMIDAVRRGRRGPRSSLPR